MKKRICIAAAAAILCMLLPAVSFSQEAESGEAESGGNSTEAEVEGDASIGWGNSKKDSNEAESGSEGESRDASKEDGPGFVLTWGGDTESETAPPESSGGGLWGKMREKQEDASEEDMTKDVEGAYFRSTTLYLDTMFGGGGIGGVGVSYYLTPGILELKLTSLLSLVPHYDSEGDGEFLPSFTGLFKVNYYFFGDKYHTPYAGGGLSYTNTYEGAISAFAFGVAAGYEGRFDKIGSLYGELNFYIDTAGYTAFSPSVGWKTFW